MDKIVAPKQACPRDLGFWYCQNCINRQAESQSEVNFVVPLTFCGTKYGDRTCGDTHQGYELCKDCIVAGREKYAHIGEYETVSILEEEVTMEQIVDDAKRHAAIGAVLSEVERMHSLFRFDEFGTLLKEQIKILFVGQDDWEYETELPAVPRVGDVIFFWLDKFVRNGKVTEVHWTITPDKHSIAVLVDLEKEY